MHLGNVWSALLSWLTAKKDGGEWVLRIEDLDPQRSRREYAEQLMDDLRWLGLTWDALYWQSERFAIYQQHLDRLIGKGIVYPCYCTRADIMSTQAPHESDGRIVYKGTCRPKDMQAPKSTKWGDYRTLRLYVPDEEISYTDLHYGPQKVNLALHCGDFVLQRADGAWAYQLAVAVDDALMGITHVVRGRDLLLSAPQQIYVQRLLGYTPPSYCHHPLLLNRQEQRLCKRDKSMDMGELRQRYQPEELLGLIAYYAHLIPKPQPLTLEDMLSRFSWEHIPTQDITVSESL